MIIRWGSVPYSLDDLDDRLAKQASCFLGLTVLSSTAFAGLGASIVQFQKIVTA
jgi:hypothetical protein